MATNAFQSGTVQPQTPGDVPAFVLRMAVEISLASNFKSFDSNIFILFGILVKIHKSAPAFSKTEAASNLPAKMLNIKGVALWE